MKNADYDDDTHQGRIIVFPSVRSIITLKQIELESPGCSDFEVFKICNTFEQTSPVRKSRVERALIAL